MFIKKLKKKFGYNEPIFTYEILSLFKQYTKAYVLRLLKKAVEQGEITKFDRGIYFFPKMTFIGPSMIIPEDVVRKKYIKNKKDVYGVICGLGMDNGFHLCPQMANVIEVATNNEPTRKREITIDGCRVILYRSRCKITKNNFCEYTILQLMNQFDPRGNTYEELKESVIEYMKLSGAKEEKIISISKYFPQKATNNLLKSGVLQNVAI